MTGLQLENTLSIHFSHMSHGKFADMIMVSRQTISNWIVGRHRIPAYMEKYIRLLAMRPELIHVLNEI